jgi:ABC-type uncharacterized transport system involved in gliding motility auxiliary subunit
MSDRDMAGSDTGKLGQLSDILGWAGMACVAGGVIVRFAVPAREQLSFWSLIAGIVLILLYGVTQWRQIADSLGRRQIRSGALAFSSIFIALGILLLANFVLARQNVRWDLTAARQYSLAPQTIRLLESLDSPIRMMVFAQEIDFPGYRDRLQEYAYTSSQVELEYVDIDKNPSVARQYEVQAYGTVVIEYEGRVERVGSDDEQDVTNALIKVIEGEEQHVYFVQGHGERSPDDSERTGYSGFRDALRRDNFSVDTVVIAQTGTIPTDASVLVVAGPTTDYLPGEITILREYLEAGGKALFLIDPADSAAAVKQDQSNLIALLAEWAIDVGSNVIVDVSGVGQLLGTGPTVPLASQYPPHPITDDFELLTAFPLARSVTPVSGGVDGRIAESFAETSPQSWAETSLDELAGGEVSAGDDDLPGPISIGAAVAIQIEVDPTGATGTSAADTEPVTADIAGTDLAGDTAGSDEATATEARVAVVGDSDFASNAALGTQGNRDLALNTINWLAQQENLIAIRPREPEDRRITITAMQQRNIFWLSFLIIPGAVLGSGVFTWWRRR